MTWTTAKIALEQYNIHASETGWIGTEFDAVIDNNSTMDHLYQQINDLVQGLPESKDDPGV
jgi:dephospho-CoA kinase